MIACEKCGYTSAGVMEGFRCPQMTCDGRIVAIPDPCPECGGDIVARDRRDNERACVDCGLRP